MHEGSRLCRRRTPHTLFMKIFNNEKKMNLRVSPTLRRFENGTISQLHLWTKSISLRRETIDRASSFSPPASRTFNKYKIKSSTKKKLRLSFCSCILSLTRTHICSHLLIARSKVQTMRGRVSELKRSRQITAFGHASVYQVPSQQRPSTQHRHRGRGKAVGRGRETRRPAVRVRQAGKKSQLVTLSDGPVRLENPGLSGLRGARLRRSSGCRWHRASSRARAR